MKNKEFTYEQLEQKVIDLLADNEALDQCCKYRKEENIKLAEQLAEREKDVERYKKLRSMHWNDKKLVVVDPKYVRLGTFCYNHNFLDEKLDEMEEEKDERV